MNYSGKKHIKQLSDEETGEIKTYKEITIYKQTAKKGWNMMYQSYLEEVMCSLSGKKETQILFWILDRFKKGKSQVIISQKDMAKVFETTQQYISKTISKLIVLNVLMKIHKIDKKQYYRLNPYLSVPPGEDAVALQNEWDKLNRVIGENNIKDKFEYLVYLDSNEWSEIKDKAMIRDNNSCQECGSTNSLECHHLTYENIYNEKLDDLQILCKVCHKNVHK